MSNTAAILNAASSDGEYFPSSIALTVWRVTSILSANSCCVISPCSKRSRLISFRMVTISGAAPILDDLTACAQQLGRHKNEKQVVCVEDNRWIECAKKAGERDARREARVSDPGGSEFDQFLAFISRRLCFFR